METCDVLVVGAGPAGTACARRLREAGVDVRVRDRAVLPRPKACAGWLTPEALPALGLDPREYAASGRTLQPVTGFRTGRIGGGSVTTRYARVVSWAILRTELDHYLLERSGARFAGGTPVRRLARRDGCWIVDDAIRAPVVVGAGGHFCPVARALDRGVGPGPVVVAGEVEFAMDAAQRAGCRVEPDTPEIYFCTDLKGYGWCVRKGDHLNVGLGRRDPRRLGAHLAAFVAFVTRDGRIRANLPPRWAGHAYLLEGGSSRRPVADGTLLVGDALGLAAPFSGEGILAAAESGRLAAEVIVEAGGRHRAEDLAPYAERLAARRGRSRTSLALPAAVARTISPALLRDAWFARHVILDRWFLHARRQGPAPAP